MYITIGLSILISISIYFLLTSRSKLNELKIQYARVEETYEPASREEKKLAELTSEYQKLQSDYQEKLANLRTSEKRLSHYYLGVGTTDSVSYRKLAKDHDIGDIEGRLQDVKASLKRLISEKKACVCSMGKDVVVNGKKSEAKKLFNREIKLRLRCLDNEFKAAKALVDWNNVNRLIQRTQETFNEINASGAIVQTYLKDQYLKLKIEELRLTYELNEAKQDLKEAEREEASLIREAEREEKRIKAAAEKAEKDRKLMEKLVAKELAKLESSSAEQKALYELHKQQLEELKEKEKRAISLAQTTRAGYVYIISNTTSFGEGVVKIGMTRRADPNDRVKELGDASVPELFEVHAFAFSDDAPSLEKHLHNTFSEQRVNLVNNRKEFFTVSPSEVLEELKEYNEPVEIELFNVEAIKCKGEMKSPNESLTKPVELRSNKKCAELTPVNTPIATFQKNKKKEHNDVVKEQENVKEKQQKKETKSKSGSPQKTNQIRLFAINKYPNDVEMQQYEYEEQVEAKEFMDREASQQEIKAFAVKKYPSDYSMQQYVYEEQVEAKEFMDIEATQQEIKAFAVKKYPSDYSMQQYVYEEQVEAKEFMDKEAIQQEIKALAVKKHPDDFSMQQYVYEDQVEAR